jgi:glucose/arabinose dehydrogenase
MRKAKSVTPYSKKFGLNIALIFSLSLFLIACGDTQNTAAPSAPTTPPNTTAPTNPAAPSATNPNPPTVRPTLAAPGAIATVSNGQPTGIKFNSTTTTGQIQLEVFEVARNLDTVWSLAWKNNSELWFTERQGKLTRLGAPPQNISGVVEQGEGGLMGVAFDKGGRTFLMYTAANDNRVVRLEADGSQKVLVDGIAKANIHNGGRIIFGADGMLYVSTGDAARADNPGERNGKILKVNPDSGAFSVFSSGLRNTQGLCFDSNNRLFSTEHGPSVGDEINLLTQGFDGGWSRQTGNGLHNYTPTIAPSGCIVYNANLIPAWQNSLLFVSLKENSLRRLTFGADGKVTNDEVLLRGQFGRLRDIAVAPDGAVYLTTSNGDGRGNMPAEGDRILRIVPTN